MSSSFQKGWLFQRKVVPLQQQNPPSLFTMLKSAGRFFIRKCFNNAKDKTPVPMSVPPRLFRCSGHRGGFICCFNVYLNPNYLKKM